jgi:hypothetical protein
VPQICLITCSRLPDLDDDDRLLIEPLAQLGYEVVPAVWDDPTVDWDRCDLNIIRSTWDYTEKRDEFVRWARSVPRLLNPANVIEWNTDKRYLDELAAAGLPVVQTTFVTALGDLNLPAEDEFVLKPAIGAGSLGADRYDSSAPAARERATQHAARLIDAGHTVMIQPFVHSIVEAGETSVMLFNGEFSHAIRKELMLGAHTLAEVEGLYKEEQIDQRGASDAELALAQRTLAVLPFGSADLLYARVDMVPGENGQPMLMEVELTEPSMFMVKAPGSQERFASAIAERAKKEAGRAPQRSKPGL